MSQRFYLKRDPKISITLPNGVPWKNWNIIDHDHGVIAPQNQYLADALAECVRQGVGGVTEISEAEYNEWLKKKQTSLRPRWRDEWAKPSGNQLEAQPQSQDSSDPRPAVPVATELRPKAVRT